MMNDYTKYINISNNNEKIFINRRDIIATFADYGLIIGTGIENIGIYFISEGHMLSYGLISFFKDNYKYISICQSHAIRGNRIDMINDITNFLLDIKLYNNNKDIYLDNFPNDISLVVGIDTLISKYINEILNLKPRNNRGSFLIGPKIMKDIKFTYQYKKYLEKSILINNI